MVASLEDAQEFVLDYAQRFLDAIISANEEQKTSLSPRARAKTKKRSISSLMNDIVAFNLIEKLSDIPGIKFDLSYNQLKIIFSPNFILKCKKSENGKISYINTQSMFDFMHQLPTMLPNMPSPATNIFLVYEWNKTRTEINKVAIQCPAGKHSNFWEVPIALPSEPLPQITNPIPTATPLETGRVIPKPKKIKKLKNSKGLGNNEQHGKEN